MTTTVSIASGGFALNGTPTYAGRSWKGHRIEGLLFNSRMAPSPTTTTLLHAAPGPTPTATGMPSAARASSSPPCPPTAPTACSAFA